MIPAPHLAPAAAAQSSVLLVVMATMAAQVASIMGVAVFPVIAPQLAAEMEVAPALIGYQMSLVYGAAMIAAPAAATAAPMTAQTTK